MTYNINAVNNTYSTHINAALPKVMTVLVRNGIVQQNAVTIVGDTFMNHSNQFINSLPQLLGHQNNNITPEEFEGAMYNFIHGTIVPAIVRQQQAMQNSMGMGNGYIIGNQQSINMNNNNNPYLTTGNVAPNNGYSLPVTTQNKTIPLPTTTNNDNQSGVTCKASDDQVMDAQSIGEMFKRKELMELGEIVHSNSSKLANLAESTHTLYKTEDGEVAINNITILRGMNGIEDLLRIRDSLVTPAQQDQTYDIYTYPQLVTLDVGTAKIKDIFMEIHGIIEEAKENVQQGEVQYRSVFAKILDIISPGLSKFLLARTNSYLRRYIFFAEPKHSFSLSNMSEYEVLTNMSKAGLPRYEQQPNYYGVLEKVTENVFGDLIYVNGDYNDKKSILCDVDDSYSAGEYLHAAGNQFVFEEFTNRDYGYLLMVAKGLTEEEKYTEDERDELLDGFLDKLHSKTVFKVDTMVVITKDETDRQILERFVGRMVPEGLVRSVDVIFDKLQKEKTLLNLPIIDIHFPESNKTFELCFGLDCNRPFIRDKK